MKSRRGGRLVRAYVRDTWVLVRQFRYALIFFLVFLLIGTLVIHYVYRPAPLVEWGEAFHIAVKLMFFETVAPYPEHPLARAVFVLWPVLGLVLVVNGVVRFGTALFSRQERKEAWQVAVASTYRNHVVVCGLGKVGYRVTLQLLEMGQDVVGIEDDAGATFIEPLRNEGVPVLVGDARTREMQEKARLPEASAVVACTADDLTNLEIALEARDLKPGLKVVMRMFDGQLAKRVRRGFGIRTAVKSGYLAAQCIINDQDYAAAAQAYFAKSVGELDLAECALLAGLPQAPALYNPLVDLDAALRRQRVVLDLMVKQGYISPQEADLAAGERLGFAPSPFPIRAPHFVAYVWSALERALGVETLAQGGLQIHTTLDVDLQEKGEGIHHVSFGAVNDHDQIVTDLAGQGVGIEMQGLVFQREDNGLQLAELRENETSNRQEVDDLIGRLTGLRIQSLLGKEAKAEE